MNIKDRLTMIVFAVIGSAVYIYLRRYITLPFYGVDMFIIGSIFVYLAVFNKKVFKGNIISIDVYSVEGKGNLKSKIARISDEDTETLREVFNTVAFVSYNYNFMFNDKTFVLNTDKGTIVLYLDTEEGSYVKVNKHFYGFGLNDDEAVIVHDIIKKYTK